tara:strand:+ start:1735 stop:6927 length:5193 start_codon:yes stop_codon:yes gene_type:complete
VANTVTLTFKVNEDGSLAQVGKAAEKTAKSTDKATKASSNYSKGQKGVAQAGMNSTKAFSKQKTLMSGGNGLVGAYAGLAANIFALTAAFGALSRASRANQLEEGLLSLGEASGLAMHTLSRGLVEATGNAISLEEGMRSVALITSSGIDSGSLERFGKVARGAATALGRDVQDSISRLTRGITKLEPELLDELGIMVRLDEASKTYADSLGKSVSELTRYEKQQAFLNATLTEGEKKFGALANVNVNVFDKLSASLSDLIKSGLGGFTNMIEPVIGYLSESPTALVGVMIAFGATIAGVVVGSLADMAETAANATAATIQFTASGIKQAATLNTSSKTLKKFVRTVEEGGNVTKAYKSAIVGQTKSVEYYNHQLKAGKIDQKQFDEQKKKSKKIVYDLSIATQQHALAQVQDASASAMLNFSQGNLAAGFKDVWASMTATLLTMKTGVMTATSFKAALNGLAVSAKAAAVSMKSLGAGIMAAMGPIGIAIAVLTIMYDILMGIINFFKSDATKTFEKATSELADTQSELAKNLQEVDAGLAGTSDKIFGATSAYKALDAVLSQFNTKFKAMDKVGKELGEYDEQITAQEALIASSEVLTLRFNQFKSENPEGFRFYDSDEKESTAIQKFLKEFGLVTHAVSALDAASKGAKQGIQDFLNAEKIKTDVDDVVGGIIDLNSILLKVSKDGQTIEFNPKLLGTENFSEILNDAISDEMAITYGLAAQKKELLALDTQRTGIQKTIIQLEEDIKKNSTNSLGGTKISEEQQQRIDNDKVLLANAKRIMAEKKKEGDESTSQFAKDLHAEQERWKVLQLRRVTEKQNIALAKEELSLAKQMKVNTQASLDERISKGNAYLEIQRKAMEAEQKELQIRLDRLPVASESVALSVDEIKQVKDLTIKIKLLKMQQENINKKKLEGAEITLATAKMQLGKLQEEQKIKRAILKDDLDLVKGQREQLSIANKLAELAQKRANRLSGVTDSKAQLLAIELDDKNIAKKLSFILEEAKLKKAGARLDSIINKAKLTVLREELRVINEKRKAADKETTDFIGLDELDALISSTGTLDLLIANIDANARVLTEELILQRATTNEIAMLEAERLQHALKINNLAKEESELRIGMVKSSNSLATVALSIAAANNTDIFGDPRSQIKAAKIAKDINNAKIDASLLELEATKLRVALEQSIIEQKYALMKAQFESDGNVTQREADILNKTKQVMNAQVLVNQQSIKAAENNIRLVEAQADSSNRQAIGAASGNGFAASLNVVVGQNKAGEAGKTNTTVPEIKPLSKDEKISAYIVKGFEESSVQHRILSQLELIQANTAGGSTGTSAIENSGGSSSAPLGPLSDIDTSAVTTAGLAEFQATFKAQVAEDFAAFKVGLAASISAEIKKQLAGGATDNSSDVGAGVTETTEDTEKKPFLNPENLDNLRGHLKGMANDMAALGPDGVGPAMMMEGMASITTAMDSSKEGSERAQAAISGVAQIMAGAAASKVNSLDKEIAAEKKRDGKSSASIAKIKSMEKKKEAIKKKAFDVDKKLKMAGVITATAMGIMEYMAEKNPMMAAAVGIMGAAQLAIIGGTSYEGSGSAGAGASGNTKISSGERSNTIDLAKGNNSAGELAYMRGAQGIGNATDFKPKGAFSGYKNRAAGGYIVGEQGPELFMPEVPGDIIASGQGMGGATNVTFQISTVDASGVEDLLSAQRGNIIGMIREAANEHGEFFLESVDERSYTQ